MEKVEICRNFELYTRLSTLSTALLEKEEDKKTVSSSKICFVICDDLTILEEKMSGPLDKYIVE